MTKAITAVAALRLVQDGGIALDDPDGTICIVMTQVEMNARVFALLGELQGLSGA